MGSSGIRQHLHSFLVRSARRQAGRLAFVQYPVCRAGAHSAVRPLHLSSEDVRVCHVRRLLQLGWGLWRCLPANLIRGACPSGGFHFPGPPLLGHGEQGRLGREAMEHFVVFEQRMRLGPWPLRKEYDGCGSWGALRQLYCLPYERGGVREGGIAPQCRWWVRGWGSGLRREERLLLAEEVRTDCVALRGAYVDRKHFSQLSLE